jgi:selenocysteine lyase/cysteine desulfurase
MDNNTVTITIDAFADLIRDSQKLAILTHAIKNSAYNSDLKAIISAMEGGSENA